MAEHRVSSVIEVAGGLRHWRGGAAAGTSLQRTGRAALDKAPTRLRINSDLFSLDYQILYPARINITSKLGRASSFQSHQCSDHHLNFTSPLSHHNHLLSFSVRERTPGFAPLTLSFLIKPSPYMSLSNPLLTWEDEPSTFPVQEEGSQL